jgi:hypothetical protein
VRLFPRLPLFNQKVPGVPPFPLASKFQPKGTRGTSISLGFQISAKTHQRCDSTKKISNWLLGRHSNKKSVTGSYRGIQLKTH